MPNAAVFSSMATLDQETVSSTPVVRKLPAPLTSLQKPGYASMTSEELKEAYRDVFASMAVINDEVAFLEAPIL